jgi:hypothetical protein
VFDALVSGLAQYERQPGNPTSYEISFAQDPARGAAYGLLSPRQHQPHRLFRKEQLAPLAANRLTEI